MSDKAAESEALRLDKWLWFARFCKTRALSQKLIESGHVTVNGAKVCKVSANVRVGDGIELVLGPVKRVITVRAMAERPGPAPEAQLLYEEMTPAEKLTGLEKGLPLHKSAHKPLLFRPRGAGRPTKKDRREITKHMNERWDDGEA